MGETKSLHQPLANCLFLSLNRCNPFMNCYSFSSLAHWHKYSLALISLPLRIFPPIIFAYFYTSLFPFFLSHRCATYGLKSISLIQHNQLFSFLQCEITEIVTMDTVSFCLRWVAFLISKRSNYLVTSKTCDKIKKQSRGTGLKPFISQVEKGSSSPYLAETAGFKQQAVTSWAWCCYKHSLCK